MTASDSNSESNSGPSSDASASPNPRKGRRRNDRGQDRVRVALACEECEARNYETTRPKRDGAAPLALKKFCSHCNKHTLHKETR